MTQWIVFRQIPSSSPCSDYWDDVYVDVEAESNVEACKETAKDKGEGRYLAFPNEYAMYFDIKVKPTFNVEVGQGESMV